MMPGEIVGLPAQKFSTFNILLLQGALELAHERLLDAKGGARL